MIKSTNSVNRIPIRNVWLLILFASKLYRHYDDLPKKFRQGAIEDSMEDIVAFAANLLINATERRLRRELNQHFERKTAEIARVRGKIDVLSTERKQLLQKGLVCCRFYYLSVNTECNRYVKAALERAHQLLCKPKRIRPHEQLISRRCRSLATRMNLSGVVGDKPRFAGERELLRHRNDRDERLMFFAATLIFELDLPAQDSEEYWQWATHEDKKFLSELFEKAVAGFYDVRLSATPWKVRPQTHLRWPISTQSANVSDWLPIMKTDLDLVNRSNGQRIILDTKFNEILIENRFKQLKFHSQYIFQIYSYIKSQNETRDSSIHQVDGLLLHPSVGQTIDEYAVIQGHRLRFRTVDLTQSSTAIQEELLSIIQEWPQ